MRSLILRGPPTCPVSEMRRPPPQQRSEMRRANDPHILGDFTPPDSHFWFEQCGSEPKQRIESARLVCSLESRIDDDISRHYG